MPYRAAERQLAHPHHGSAALLLVAGFETNRTCGSKSHAVATRPLNAYTFMDILDSLRQAPSAELYRLYLAIGKMLDDPRRILEVRQRLHLGMEVSYFRGDALAPPSHGTVVELRQTQAVI